MKKPELDLNGRSVLITGAATGIGRATAMAFAAVVDRAVAEFGSLDIAFNNAGLLLPTAPLAEMASCHRRRRHRRLSLAEARTRAYGEDGAWIDHQHRIGRGFARRRGHGALCGGQARGSGPDEGCRRINAIAPGLVRTPITERWLNDPEMREKVFADSPIRRIAEPEDIAALGLFLAFDLSSIITGAVYPIDGARTAH